MMAITARETTSLLQGLGVKPEKRLSLSYTAGTAVSCAGYEHAIYEIDVIGTSYQVQVRHHEEGAWVPTSVTRMQTGTPMGTRIHAMGTYYVSLEGAFAVRLLREEAVIGPQNVNLVLLHDPPTIPASRAPARPVPILPTAQGPAYTLNDQHPTVEVSDMDVDTGTLYGMRGSEIVKSADYGVTYTVLNDTAVTGDPLGRPYMLDTGRILLVLSDGFALGTEAADLSWTFVRKAGPTKPDGSTYFVDNNYGRTPRSFHNFGEQIGYAPYQNPQMVRQQYVHRSLDGGETWNFMPVGSDQTQTHLHSVEIDPYTGRWWITVGDSFSADIYFSDDQGATWQSSKKIVQETGLEGHLQQQLYTCCLPQCVLFSSDNTESNGVWRLERSAYEVGQRDALSMLKLEPGLIFDAPGLADYPITVEITRSFYKTGAVYCLDRTSPTRVWGSRDGWHWTMVLQDAPNDMRGLRGPDTKGNLIGTTSDGVVVFPALEWA